MYTSTPEVHYNVFDYYISLLTTCFSREEISDSFCFTKD
jgi:hypothetical protein